MRGLMKEKTQKYRHTLQTHIEQAQQQETPVEQEVERLHLLDE
jgi:hypothetical protein